MTDQTDRLALEPHNIQTPEQQIEYWYEKWENTFDELGQQINATNGAYRERAQLVALLAATYGACWNFGDQAESDWAVVYVNLPTGQASWHIHESDMGLFDHVGRNDGMKWDGHTTAEKYERIRRIYAATPADALPVTCACGRGLGPSDGDMCEPCYYAAASQGA